jgi:hypothetical protein
MRTCLISFLITCCFKASAQNILNQSIVVKINSIPLEQALKQISNKGNFYFSYNSNIIPAGKIVSYPTSSGAVKQILDYILESKYEYIERDNYIILRLLPLKLTIFTQQAILEERFYSINGFVMDDRTERRLRDASVYEKTQLASTITDNEGYFRIRLKSKYKSAAITISKQMYEDTTVAVSPKVNQQLNIFLTPVYSKPEIVTIKPADYFNAALPVSNLIIDTVINSPSIRLTDTLRLERNRRARFLLTARQKIQGLNLRNFITSRPYQVSFTPGLSTQGKLSAQVVNNVSLNVLGGYTGGVNGAEVAGLFNINKRNVQFAQAAGLFNLTGGSMTGVQLAGLNNTVFDRVDGVQAAGISNIAKGALSGIQLSGVYNHVSNSLSGLQVAGISNYAKQKVKGIQVAGIANISSRHMDGIQLAGIFNYAKKLRGVQVGLLNIADTSEGYSIGLLNIVMKGYHKLVFSTNEVLNVNAAFKTGNSKLYSMLIAGLNTGNNEKAYAFGYGIGTEIKFTNWSSINPELSSQYVYLGSFNDFNLLNKFQLDLHLNFGKHFSIFGGPSVNAYYSDQSVAVPGYKTFLPKENHHTFKVTNKSTGWIGWNVGVSLF